MLSHHPWYEHVLLQGCGLSPLSLPSLWAHDSRWYGHALGDGRHCPLETHCLVQHMGVTCNSHLCLGFCHGQAKRQEDDLRLKRNIEERRREKEEEARAREKIRVKLGADFCTQKRSRTYEENLLFQKALLLTTGELVAGIAWSTHVDHRPHAVINVGGPVHYKALANRGADDRKAAHDCPYVLSASAQNYPRLRVLLRSASADLEDPVQRRTGARRRKLGLLEERILVFCACYLNLTLNLTWGALCRGGPAAQRRKLGLPEELRLVSLRLLHKP